MSKYCVYSGRDCEILPSTEKEIWDNAFYQGRIDAIEECAEAFKELAIKWFESGQMRLGDIPRLAEQLMEKKE